MRTFYVITASWREVLEEVIGWSDNYYIANTYYNNYNDDSAEMFVYECDSVMSLSIQISQNHGVPISDVSDLYLMGKPSQDDKLYMIYQSKYHVLLDKDTPYQLSKLCSMRKSFLMMAPLLKYINNSDIISESVFRAYSTMGSVSDIDPVYLLNYISRKSDPGILFTIDAGLGDFSKRVIFINTKNDSIERRRA